MKEAKFILVFVAILFVSGIGYSAAYYSTSMEVTVTVTSKERITKVRDGHDQSYYLVYTDAGTFKVEDSIILFRWNSSDVYGGLNPNQQYKIKVVGFRLPLFSEYPNIVSYTELN